MHAAEVHVACARSSDIAAQDWIEFDDWLDERERARARRFRFQADRNAYVLAHALRRALVARATGRSPESICFSHTALGQPRVEGEPHICISNSATREAAACAVSLGGPVGVDIEGIDAREPDRHLLASFVVPGAQQCGAREFFLRWALLEAFWKSWGTGLAQDNARILISVLDDERFDIRTEGDGGRIGGTGWVLQSFDDCATALAMRERPRKSLCLWQARCNSANDVKQLSRAISFGPVDLPI